jgi:ABC-2 type transport system permease protein
MNSLTTLWLLFRMQLTSMRWFWRGLLFGGFAVPIFTLVLLKFMGAGRAGELADARRFLAGMIVVSLLFGNMSQTASRFSFLRTTGALDYYATLLARKSLLILAVVCAFLVMSLPGVLFALIAGGLWLGVPLQPSPLLIPALILGAVSLAVLGAVVGVYSQTPEQSSLTVNLLTLGLSILSPVLAPREILPVALQWTSILTPTTYAVQAVQAALTGQVGVSFWRDLAVLSVFCIVAIGLVGRRLDWRA